MDSIQNVSTKFYTQNVIILRNSFTCICENKREKDAVLRSADTVKITLRESQGEVKILNIYKTYLYIGYTILLDRI